MSKFKSTVDKRRLVAAVILGAAGALAAGAVTPALAMPVPITGDPMPGMPGMDHGMPMNGMPEAPAPAKPAKGPAAFFTADLTGAQEVPVAGGPAVGAPNGKASAVVEIKGDRVTFGFTWSGISAPTLSLVVEALRDADGEVAAVDVAERAGISRGTARRYLEYLASLGSVELTLRYTNLHTQEFPGGAVRGQLKPSKKHQSVLSFIHGGKLRAIDTGGQEVPVANGPKVGDPDGLAASFLDARGTTVGYSFAWINIAPPTLGHVHQGQAGKNGDVKVGLFTTAIPANIFAISGNVSNVDASLVKQIQRNPHGFYTNLHTQEFPGGAVRGQLF